MRRISERMGFWVVVLFGAALVGCGEGDGASTGGAEGQVTTYGATSSKIRGMDPMDIGDTTSSGMASNIYDCLYQYHYLKRPYQLVPSLAAEMPTISEDGLTYTIKLRDDVYFQDDECFKETGGKGRKLVAEDFVYSWKRIANIKNISKNWWIFDGKIKGFDDFREYTKTVESKKDVDYSRPVEGLEAVDDLTLRITLVKPWPQVVYYLSHLPSAAVPREAVGHYGEEFINHPVGTGPYRLKTWRHGSKIVLERNPTFREELYPSEGEPGDEAKGLLVDAGKPMPLIDRVDISIIEESQPLWLKLMAGELDIGGIPKDNFDTAISPTRDLTPDLRAKGVVLEKYEDAATYWYGFNMEDPLLGQNKPLRQAMNLAIDRQEFLEKFLNNRGIPARGILPPMIAGYDVGINSPYTVYDLELAKQKIKEAEKLNGGPIPVIVLTMGGTDSTQRQVGQFFIRSYEKVGLTLEVDYMDWPSAQEKVKTKSAQMYAMGWVADIPDAENFMQLFYGPNGSPGANNMNYKNPVVDALYEKIAEMGDTPERIALIREMQQLVVDDMPCVLTIHRVAFILRYDWLRNYKPHVFGYGLAKYRNLDAELRLQRVGR